MEYFQPERRLRREYNNYILFQHRSFDVKGLTTQGTFTLELERVFVDLGLGFDQQAPRHSTVTDLQAAGDALADPLRRPTDNKKRDAMIYGRF